MESNQSFRIIIIDDNPEIHRDFIKVLTKKLRNELDEMNREIFGAQELSVEQAEFEINTAFQGEEGIRLVKQAINEGRPYALAFVDIRMPPGLDGIETIKQIWQFDKDIQIVICTAYSDYSWEQTVDNIGSSDNLLILKKPFDNTAVRQLVSALTKKWQLMQEARKYTLSLERKIEESADSLEKTQSLMKATIESTADGIMVVDNEGRITDYNEIFVDMFSIPQELIQKREDDSIITFLAEIIGKNASNYLKKIDELNRMPDAVSTDILKFKTGKIVERFSQPHYLNGKAVGRVWSYRDITNRAKLEEKLHYQAIHDPLTGFPNRMFLLNQMERLISDKNFNLMFAVILFDLDRFKLINDSFNHDIGDKFLKAVATRLLSAVRASDFVARLGGDEFVILITNLNEETDIKKFLDKLVAPLSEPFKVEDREVTITASIGVSFYPRDGIKPEALLKNADSAMCAAKEGGGNQFKIYTKEMSHHSLVRLDMESQLRHAIINNEFFLCYQPQFNLTTGELIGMEALIRWQHPVDGLVLPNGFIPVAEESGLIVPMGGWVLKTACMQNKKWQDQGLLKIPVAVNVAEQQLKINFVDLVRNVLEETQLAPEHLELELTENVMISHVGLIDVINDLKKLGVNIALDDFGIGYTSLSYLKKISLDKIKIDKSFIQNIQINRDDEAIIKAVTAMAKSLGIKVIAEGVEVQDQVQFLKNMECEEVQGFYFSKPLLLADMEKLLESATKKSKT